MSRSSFCAGSQTCACFCGPKLEVWVQKWMRKCWALIACDLVIAGLARPLGAADNSPDLPEPFRTVLGIHVGSSSFEDVEDQLGKATWSDTVPEHRGGGDVSKSICYRLGE